MSDEPEPEFYSIETLAERYDVSPHTVRGWRARGEAPPAHKICGQVRFHRAAVLAWEAHQAEAATAA
jgi:DNA-binding transcriptional MerR regulator